MSTGIYAKTDTLVVISTDYGTIKVKLYKDTPLHRNNFLKLVQSGFYDSILFHRVINTFMIQGGDPDSKHAKPGQFLGNGDLDYTISPEILPHHFHKKGVLAAARESDDVNPGKLSSACQFYIVQGKKFTSADIAQVERRIYNNDKQTIFWQFLNKPENSRLKERYVENQSERNTDSLNYLNQLIQPQIENEIANIKIHKFTPAELEAYTEVGGAPHLDGSYTVFGEVVEGIEVVDKIAAVGVDHNNRPIEDIRMKMKIEIINY